ncbi:MAG: hypothetical protein AABN33_20330 [Acidobacteriota bacterium]
MGFSYFGCTPAGLEEDISYHRFAEARGEVVPVHVDQTGRAYVEFSSPEQGKTTKYVLEEHGYNLRGNIATFSEEERAHWRTRESAENAEL